MPIQTPCLITEFVDWYCSEPRLAFNRTVVLRYRIYLEQRLLAPTTINLRLAAVRRVAYEAADSGLLSPELAAGIRRVKGVRRIGLRLGNWLTADQGRCLLLKAARGPLGYRRSTWKGGSHPNSSDSRLGQRSDQRLDLRQRNHGRSDLPVNQQGWQDLGDGMTPKVIWEIVKRAAKAANIEKLAPHDLRRTCARLCHLAGGELDQIQFLLGHVSIQTTERYLGCKQKLRFAVNDKLGLEP
jgi:Phage integrase family